MFVLAIIGSRNFNDYNLLKGVCDNIRNKYDITHIVSGGAKGADSLGEQYAELNGLRKIIYLPDWEKHGKAAGFIRNKEIIRDADFVVAFWDGISKGTLHSINLSKESNKRGIIVNTSSNTFHSF